MRGRKIFFVIKTSPDAVAIPERKGWKNRCLASGIVTALLPVLFDFLSGARRAREKISDRWNNVCRRRPENVGFWRGHCSTTVPGNSRGAARAGRPGLTAEVRGGRRRRRPVAISENARSRSQVRYPRISAEGVVQVFKERTAGARPFAISVTYTNVH